MTTAPHVTSTPNAPTAWNSDPLKALALVEREGITQIVGSADDFVALLAAIAQRGSPFRPADLRVCLSAHDGLTLGLHTWTERNFGFGAPTIAILDAAATSPFAQLSMIPLLTLCAVYAPAGRRASWFALMASLMNIALVAGGLLTKYLNQILVVARGDYANLPMLLGAVLLIGFVMPVAAILLVGRRLR